MKVVNILLNYKKATHNNQILGVERCFIDYTKQLIEHDNEVVSVTKSDMCYRDEILKLNSQLFELTAFNKFDIFSIFKLTILFLKFRPNVIICHSGRALTFSRIARIFSFSKAKIISIDHGINPLKFLKSDYVLTVNSYFSNQLIKAGKSKDHCFTIPNMIEIPSDFKLPIKDKFPNVVRIGSLGRLYHEKYFDKVIHAMKILKDKNIECEYVIGGVGPMEQSLKDLAKDLGLENKFKILGWVSKKKEFFENIDIFILPSLAETFGIVLLEAMLYNTPIITTNSWGPDEIIDHEINGLKVSKDDKDKISFDIADAIIRLINNQDFAKQLTKNAHDKFMNNFSTSVIGKRLNDIIHKIS